MFKQPVKDYFTFSGAERRGIIILLVFILLTLAFRFILPLLLKQTVVQKTTFGEEVNQWLDALAANDVLPDDPVSSKKTGTMNFILSDFNPNIISPDEIKNLGVTSNVRRAWINYRAKGGKFYRKEDLKKIYGLDSITYRRLEPYIIIGTGYNQHSGRTIPVNKNDMLLELNDATQADFEYLKGIGPVFAQRICKYRDLLGGFHSIRQLTEVYGITDSIVKANENMLTVDKSMIKKIDLNKADYRTLSRHPYISDYEAKAIIHYRETKGCIESFNELIINNLIIDTVLIKLTDYLVLNEL